MGPVKEALNQGKENDGLCFPLSQVVTDRISTGTPWDNPSVLGVSEDPASRFGGGAWAGLSVRSLSTRPATFLPSPQFPVYLQHGMRPRLLLAPASPRSAASCLVSRSFPGVPVLPPASNAGVGPGGPGQRFRGGPATLTVCLLFSLYSQVRPPVALTWAPLAVPPAKRWRPGRRDPLSGRGKDLHGPLACGLRRNSLARRRRSSGSQLTSALGGRHYLPGQFRVPLLKNESYTAVGSGTALKKRGH